MSDPRQRVAQQPPAATLDLRRFPKRSLASGSMWWRQHRVGQRPWWFGSAGAGRFDLVSPAGTCYLASSAAAAVRERIGPDFVALGSVPSSLVKDRILSRLKLPDQVVVANLDAAAAAKFGVTRDLPVMVPYVVPQAWAAAFAAARFGGVIAGLRFSPGRALGLALFGDSGERAGWPVDPAVIPAHKVVAELGLRVIDPPELSQLKIIST